MNLNDQVLDLRLDEPDFLEGLWAEELPDAASPESCCASTIGCALCSSAPSCLSSLGSCACT